MQVNIDIGYSESENIETILEIALLHDLFSVSISLPTRQDLLEWRDFHESFMKKTDTQISFGTIRNCVDIYYESSKNGVVIEMHCDNFIACYQANADDCVDAFNGILQAIQEL